MRFPPLAGGSGTYSVANQNHQTISPINPSPARLTITLMIYLLAGPAYAGPFSLWGLNSRRRLALLTTVMEESDMAAPAIIGESSIPVKG